MCIQIPNATSTAGKSAAEEFVTWLNGYMAGLRATHDPAVRPPAHLEPILGELEKLRKAAEPKQHTVTVRSMGDVFAKGGVISGGVINADALGRGNLGVAARSLELRPGDQPFGTHTINAIAGARGSLK